MVCPVFCHIVSVFFRAEQEAAHVIHDLGRFFDTFVEEDVIDGQCFAFVSKVRTDADALVIKVERRFK